MLFVVTTHAQINMSRASATPRLRAKFRVLRTLRDLCPELRMHSTIMDDGRLFVRCLAFGVAFVRRQPFVVRPSATFLACARLMRMTPTSVTPMPAAVAGESDSEARVMPRKIATIGFT